MYCRAAVWADAAALADTMMGWYPPGIHVQQIVRTAPDSEAQSDFSWGPD